MTEREMIQQVEKLVKKGLTTQKIAWMLNLDSDFVEQLYKHFIVNDNLETKDEWIKRNGTMIKEWWQEGKTIKAIAQIPIVYNMQFTLLEIAEIVAN